MLQYVEPFERGIYTILLVLLFVIISLAVITLVAAIVAFVITPPVLLLTGDELLELFGAFLLVLLSLEFFESIKIYLRETKIPYELVVVIAITAIARKVIVRDLDTASDLHLIGLGVVVLALAAAYYLLKRGGITGRGTI